jgi:hypothetical protein
MPDSIVHIGENSPQHVAFKLLETIANVEKKHLFHPNGSLYSGWQMADRDWILKTYVQCLYATSGSGYHAMRPIIE